MKDRLLRYFFGFIIGLLLLICFGGILQCQPYIKTQPIEEVESYRIKASADPNTYESGQELSINVDPNGFIVPAQEDGSLEFNLNDVERYISYKLIINAIGISGVLSCPSIISFIRKPTPEKPVPYITNENCWFDQWTYIVVEEEP